MRKGRVVTVVVLIALASPLAGCRDADALPAGTVTSHKGDDELCITGPKTKDNPLPAEVCRVVPDDVWKMFPKGSKYPGDKTKVGDHKGAPSDTRTVSN
jgi:hypothetical protein